jgi:hypothetical protein
MERHKRNVPRDATRRCEGTKEEATSPVRLLLYAAAQEEGLGSYTDQVWQFLEQLVQDRGVEVAMQAGARMGTPARVAMPSTDRAWGQQCSVVSGGSDFAEVLKHLRQLDLRLGRMEKKQDEVDKNQQETQQEVESKLQEMWRRTSRRWQTSRHNCR